MRLNYLALACCAISSTAWADDYDLFNPVPDSALRQMTSERPSKTDSVNTVDSGHFEIETSLVNHVYNDDCTKGDCVTTKQWYAGGTTTLRLGLTQSAEIQLISDLYHDVDISDKTAGTRDDHSGFGDTVLRYKYNFVGNNGEELGLAVVPYVKIPTNTDHLGNNDYEGGIEFPAVWNVTDNTSIGGMTQLNWLNDPNDSGHYNTYVNSIYVSNNFTDKWSGYTEIYTLKADNAAPWQNTLDFGTVYALSDNLHVDTGVNFGISPAADDVSWFAGVAYRF